MVPSGMVAVVVEGIGGDWGQEVVLRVEVALEVVLEVALEVGEVAPSVVVEALSALFLCLLANCP